VPCFSTTLREAHRHYGTDCPPSTGTVTLSIVPKEGIGDTEICAGVALGCCDRCCLMVRAQSVRMLKACGNARRAPFRCCPSPQSLRVARTVVFVLSCFAAFTGPMATFETDALRITLPFGTLLRSAAEPSAVGHLICLSSSRLACPPFPLQTCDVYGFVTVPKWASCGTFDRLTTTVGE
jgi:hypothetical protein